jgi:sulfane dehydrogenase subunit SoxC
MEANEGQKRLPTVSGPATFEQSRDRSQIDRRTFLTRGAGIAAATATAWAAPAAAADASGAVPPWMQMPGRPMSGYGQPSAFEKPVARIVAAPYGAVAPGTGAARTPLHALEGTITPSGLHFERHHNGIPEIDPAAHRLLIHGLIGKPLTFTVPALLRYPMTSRTCFIECAGNSSLNTFPKAPQVPAGAIHGMVSCSEWSGVPLAVLLDEAGVDPRARWLLAEGADGAAMSRSVPLAKALDDAMIALYQNGERLRPEQGYPVRLLLPGWEGNMSVKWLHRIKLTEGPTHTKDETSKYSEPMPDGKARQFTFEMGVKSVITRPSVGIKMQEPGLHEIAGLAWSGAGKIRKVDVSLDGGMSWREAVLQEPLFSKSLTRFRLPWEWNGARVQLQSRAIDEKGNVQPTRASWLAQYAPEQRYHNNSIQTWAIESDGGVSNVYL